MGRFRWLLVLGLAACGGAKVAAVARPAPVAAVAAAERGPVASATTTAAVEAEPATAVVGPPREPCVVLREMVEAARRSFPEDHPAPEAAPCVTGKGGAYGVALSYEKDASDGYGPGYSGNAVLLHADAMGRVARSRALPAPSTGTYATSFTISGVADYDGDGTDELLVAVRDWEFEGNGDYGAQIWRVAGEHVEPYGPAEKLRIARLEDVDHDGLPDVIVPTPFQGRINGCGPDGNEIEFGPSWALHAQVGGGFGFDDASRAEVLRSCPKRPTRLVPRTASGVDNSELRRRLACAVIWGVKGDAIARELERDCPKPKAPLDECSYEGDLPGCVNVPQLVKWAAVKPPFTLP